MEEQEKILTEQDEIPTPYVGSPICLVETHLVNIGKVIKDIGLQIGVNPATFQVQKWYNDYAAFVYDRSNGKLLFCKSHYAGYWEQTPNILDYRKV